MMMEKNALQDGSKRNFATGKKQHIVYGTETWMSNSADSCTTKEYHRLKSSFATPYVFSQHASLPSQSPPVTPLTVYVVSSAQSC